MITRSIVLILIAAGASVTTPRELAVRWAEEEGTAREKGREDA